MNNEQLNENLKNLLDGFMAQKDLEGEIKFFDESGLTVDEQCVKELHEKKMELLRVMEEAKKDKKKLSEADMADISGGKTGLTLQAKMVIAGLAASLVSYFYNGDSVNDSVYEGYTTALSCAAKDIAMRGVGMLTEYISRSYFNKTTPAN